MTVLGKKVGPPVLKWFASIDAVDPAKKANLDRIVEKLAAELPDGDVLLDQEGPAQFKITLLAPQEGTGPEETDEGILFNAAVNIAEILYRIIGEVDKNLLVVELSFELNEKPADAVHLGMDFSHDETKIALGNIQPGVLEIVKTNVENIFQSMKYEAKQEIMIFFNFSLEFESNTRL